MATAFRLLGSFGIIVVALLALRWWTSRGGITTAKSAIKIHARAPLARGATAVILDVEERRFLVGVTENGVSLLSEMTHSEESSSDSVDETPNIAELASADSLFDLTDAKVSSGTALGWQDFTETPRTGDSQRPRNGLVRRMQEMTLRAPARVPVHGRSS